MMGLLRSVPIQHLDLMDGLILAGGKQQIKGAREDSRVYYVPKTDLRYSTSAFKLHCSGVATWEEIDTQRMMANPCIYLLDLDPTIREEEGTCKMHTTCCLTNTWKGKGREDRPKIDCE
jgi:hypothetical protein